MSPPLLSLCLFLLFDQLIINSLVVTHLWDNDCSFDPPSSPQSKRDDFDRDISEIRDQTIRNIEWWIDFAEKHEKKLPQSSQLLKRQRAILKDLKDWKRNPEVYELKLSIHNIQNKGDRLNSIEKKQLHDYKKKLDLILAEQKIAPLPRRVNR